MEKPDPLASLSDTRATGHYEVVYEACIGCGICAQVCPVKDCIVMVDELKFDPELDANKTVWPQWQADRTAYNKWFEAKSGVSAAPPKSAKAAAADAAATGGDD